MGHKTEQIFAHIKIPTILRASHFASNFLWAFALSITFNLSGLTAPERTGDYAWDSSYYESHLTPACDQE